MHLLSFTTKNLLIGLNTPHVSIKQENAGMGYNISHIKPFFSMEIGTAYNVLYHKGRFCRANWFTRKSLLLDVGVLERLVGRVGHGPGTRS